MPTPDYKCTDCGAVRNREDLTVKKTTFLGMGAGAATIRSRVSGWLCPICLVKDPEWNKAPFKAPGNARRDLRPVSRIDG